MIYFDERKNAHNTPIEGYIATVEDYTWAYYSQPQNMDKWDIIEGVFMDITNTESYKAKKEQEEQERINSLFLTGTDVERAIYKDKGMDFTDIVEYVKTNVPTMDVKALEIELRANNFYRNHPYINQIGALLGYTQEDMDFLFLYKTLPIKEETEDSEESV